MDKKTLVKYGRLLAIMLAVALVLFFTMRGSALAAPQELTPVEDGGTYPLGAETVRVKHSGYWYDFGGRTLPLAVFTAGDGRPAYSLEPALYDPGAAGLYTGQRTFDRLTEAQQSAIRRIIAAAEGGDTARYCAAQALIWETAGVGNGSTADLYAAVIEPGGQRLAAVYNELVGTVQDMQPAMPSFVSPSRQKPAEHEMNYDGTRWRVALTDTGGIAIQPEDFSAQQPLTFSASGQTLTVTAETHPAESVLVEWKVGGDSGGLIFWASSGASRILDPGIHTATGYLLLEAEPESGASRQVHLRIEAVDSGTGAALTGGRYRVQSDGGHDETVEASGATTAVTVPLPAGWEQARVTVTQLTAPEGYGPAAAWTATVDGSTADKPEAVQFRNEARESVLELTAHVKGKKTAGISGVAFRVRSDDGGERHTVETGRDGRVSLSLPSGKYFVEMTAAPDGYHLTEAEHTVRLTAGKTEQLAFPVERITGAIEVRVTAAADNPLAGDSKGAALEGAAFLVYDGGEPVDRITTDASGYGRTDPLPAGRYTVRQEAAPAHYKLSDKTFTAEIRRSGDIVSISVESGVQTLGVTLELRGNTEVLAGDDMRYELSEVANTSSTALGDFYWKLSIPTNAARAHTLHTGVWNGSTTLDALYKTNLSSNFKLLAGGLSAGTNHKLDISAAALDLAETEYITEIMVRFAGAPAGFREETGPAVVVTTLSALQEGYRFTAGAQAGGTVEGKDVRAAASWDTTARRGGELPKTGY